MNRLWTSRQKDRIYPVRKPFYRNLACGHSMDKPRITNLRIRSRHVASAAIGLVLVAVLGSIIWLFFYNSRSEGDWKDERAAPPVDMSARPPNIPEPIYKELTPEEALVENEEIPFSGAPVEAALPVVFPMNALAIVGQRTATDCLTSAIYYEGATEPLAGRRGIAQVILNRARHPAFPNSVCGVVYQGSERRTGCQFTFTCDGSLNRRPSRGGWDAARKVANAALNGAVEPAVGMATHYHADYVVPYWASSLDKIVKVGAHIFYRWKGGWGRRTAFQQKVAADDPAIMEPEITDLIDENFLAEIVDPVAAPIAPSKNLPMIDRTAGRLTPTVPASSIGASGVRTGEGQTGTPASPKPKSNLKADRQGGSLTVDDKAGSLKRD